MSAKFRRTLIGHARQFLRLMRGDVTAEQLELLAHRPRHGGRNVHEQGIGAIGVDPRPWLRLVKFFGRQILVRVLVHGAS
jgi:hypothetical protein